MIVVDRLSATLISAEKIQKIYKIDTAVSSDLVANLVTFITTLLMTRLLFICVENIHCF